MLSQATKKKVAQVLENPMSNQPKKQTLGEMLKAGERPFADREKFQKNRLAISEHSERVLMNLPLPAAPGRPRKDQEVAGTEAITIRLPLQTIEFATRQANAMGVSRNRWFNIAARRQIQDPVTEAELKPAMAANIVMFQGRDVLVTETARVPSRGHQTLINEGSESPTSTISPAYYELAMAAGRS